MKIINLKMVNVIYTQTGKEFLTPDQLEREIQDEILLHRGWLDELFRNLQGRVNVVELQPILNVDLSHIEAKVNSIVQKDRNLSLVDGEIIASYF